MSWSVEMMPGLNGYTVEWAEPGRILLSRRNRLYQADHPTAKPRLIGEVPAPLWQRTISRSRLGQRLNRFMFYNVLPIDRDRFFLTFNRDIGILDKEGFHEIEGVMRPFRVLRGACAVADSGSVYFGEYLYNEKREPMHIYRCQPAENRVEIAHTFAAGEIRHIHGVYRDPYSSAIWVATGDHPHESRLLRTTDEFKTLETVGAGDETWRTVSLQFTPDAVYFASDAEFQQNLIYRLDRQTGERTVCGEIDGPVYYSHAVGDDLFFAVTAELCPSQKEPRASLWHVTSEGGIEKIYSVAKDLGRRKRLTLLFMPGTLHFPGGPGIDGGTYFHGVSLQGIDNRTLRLYKG
ncbi:MAG: hypothetical protein ABIP75_17930 [Pyrinomonadaceae bacterium]